jgi:3-mercaptopyruvate sulfurtransferase SseA
MKTTVDEVRSLIERGATILNVGKHQGRLEVRGAIRYRPHDLLTPDHLALPIAPEKPVVIYDEKGDGDLTEQIADTFRDNGFADVRILEGGFAAWERADGETQEPSLEQIVPPMRGSEAQKLDRRV